MTCRFRVAGEPSDKKAFIINGDMVDRGAWGLETLLLFCLYKIYLPNRFFLLRGNHETATCSIMYGFKQEIEVKYGKSVGKVRFLIVDPLKRVPKLELARACRVFLRHANSSSKICHLLP